MLALAVTCEAFTLQSGEITVIEKKKPGQSDSGNNITVIIGNELLRFDGNDSLVIIKMGDRGLNISESADGRKLNLEKYEREESGRNEKNYRWDDDWEENDRYRGGRNFRGHWAGFEIGFNNYMYASSMTLPAEISYMTLNASKSNCFNLNFSQVNIGFGRHVGLVSGIGLNWNTYRFDGINSIAINSEGNIAELIPDSSVPLKKSKFNTLYLNVPLMFEIQLPAGYNRLNIAAGVIGGLKLNAWTKLVFEDGEKVRANGDYNLNLLRGGVTARIGYQNLMIFGSYYITPWFQDLKGPDTFNPEPFEIGLAFTFND